MTKKSKSKLIIAIVLVVIIAIVSGGIAFYNYFNPDIKVTASTHLYPADISDKEYEDSYEPTYYNYYSHYEKRDDYDLYVIPFKIENNSKYVVTNLSLVCEDKDYYVVDFYDQNVNEAFFREEAIYKVYDNTTGYVAGIVSVKKGTPQEKIDNIVNEINKKIVLTCSKLEETDEGPYYFAKMYVNKTFDVTDEQYDENAIEQAYAIWNSVGLC